MLLSIVMIIYSFNLVVAVPVWYKHQEQVPAARYVSDLSGYARHNVDEDTLEILKTTHYALQRQVTSRGLIHCAAVCGQSASCGAFVYENKMCGTYVVFDWVPLFRSSRGQGVSVYDTWIASDAYGVAFSRALAFDSEEPGVFKSSLVASSWNDVTQVRIIRSTLHCVSNYYATI